MAVYIDMATAQFENTNALRQFPFTDGSTMLDESGKELPLDIVVDVHLVVPADISVPTNNEVVSGAALAAPTVRLASVHLSPSMVSVCFTSEVGGVVNALSVTIARDNFRPYMPYRLEKLHGSSDIGGIVTFGDISFPGFPAIYRFVGRALDNAIVHPCCIAMAKPARLRSFVDRRSGQSVSGDVRIGFSGYIETSQSGRSIALSLEDGAAEDLRSTCEGLGNSMDACGATPIRTINGISPDADGNIVLWFH